MYQLTCPACKTPQKTPFVRLGAVAFCPSCNHRYPVKVEYFTRLAPENPLAPELVDRLLGIVPIQPVQPGPGTTSGAIPPSQIRPGAQQQPAAGQVTQAPQTARPQTTVPGQAGPSSNTAAAAGKPQTQAPAQSPAPAAAAAAQPAPQPTATPAAAETKTAEPASTGFFGKLFNRFK